MKYSIAEFIKETSTRNAENIFFDLKNTQTLEINLDGTVWMKLGSNDLLLWVGDIQTAGIAEQGLPMIMKKFVSGEGLSLKKAEGKGKVYLADHEKK